MNNLKNILWQAEFERKKNWLKAIKLLEEGKKKYPKVVDFYLLEASIYSNKKLYKKAIDNYQKADTIRPNDDTLYFKIANCYLSLGEFKIAIYYFDKISEFLPEAQYNKAIAYSRQGKRLKAIEILEKLIASSPVSNLPFFFLSEQYIATRKFGKAILLLNEAEKQFGKRKKIFFLRGLSYTYESNWLRAFIDFKGAEKLNYNSAHFFRLMGITCEKIGKTSEGIEYLLKSLRLEPFTITTYLDLINIFLLHDRIIEAYDTLEQAKKIGNMTASLTLIQKKISILMKMKYNYDHS